MALAIRWLLPTLLVAALCSPCCASTQAPGDEDEFCLDISSAPAYAPSVKPLLDSWRYRSLLQEDSDDGVWTEQSHDNDTSGWRPVPSSICQEAVKVEEPSTIPQDNWLLTQYINKSIDPSHSYSVTVFVNVSYTFESECESVNCSSYLQLLYYFSNDSDRETANDTSLYTFLANLTSSDEDSRSDTEGDSQEIEFSTNKLNISSKDGGLYLAVRDVGANVTIHRILVYRFIGPMKQIDLTLLPETPAPINEPKSFDGICVANSNTTHGGPPALNLSHTGNWTSVEPCVCIEGHYMKEIEGVPACVACDAGEYKATDGNENCLPCPSNSHSHDRGAAICTCLPSYYRNMTEGPDHPCTGPPSFPQEVTIMDVTSSSALISWNPPSDDGGRTDTFYNISYALFSEQSNPTYPEQDRITETSYNLTDLEPCSIYYIQVIAENGVSAQAGGQGQRLVGQFVQTTEGVPQITHLEALDESYVYWMPLTDDCVVISEYHIQFRVGKDDDTASFVTVSTNDSLYMVDNDNLPPTGEPIFVAVRGKSSEEGVGMWSEPILFAEKNPNSPPTVLPTITSSVPNVSSTSSSSSTGATNPTGGPGTAAPTTSPTSSTSDGAILSIVFVLLGAFVIIILVSTGALVYWLVRRYCGKYLKRFLPSVEGSYTSVKLTMSKVGDEEGKVEFIDGNRDSEEDTDGTGDTLGLIKKI